MEKLIDNPKEYYHIIKDENGKPKFKCNDMQHRFGRRSQRNDGIIQLRPQSCGNPNQYVRRLSSWFKAINYSFGNNESYSYTDTLIQFNSIKDANIFLDSIYDVINKPSNNKYYSVTAISLCNGNGCYQLPKGVIEIRNWDSDFKFYKVSEDFKTITEYDFKPLYDKLKTKNDLHKYDFVNGKIVPNLDNPTWV
jgi:hypothetical protein